MKKLLSILSLSALLLASCSKSSSPTSSNNNSSDVPTASNTMVATVDGTSYTGWTASAIKTTNSGITNITVAGADPVTGRGAGFGLINITTAGTYDVGVVGFSGGAVTGVVMTYSTKDAMGASLDYSSPQTGTTSVGKLTITEITATSIKATFNGTLSLQNGAGPATVSITHGGVNATIM